MATTQNTFTGDGSNLGPFSFTFKWLEPTDIKVTVAGVLKTAGTHYNLQSLNYATKTGGQVLFTAGNAPANGAAIVIYRQTDDTDLAATFYSGSAIRAQDLNNNFVQGLYVTQESSNNATTAIGTANTALTNSSTAISTANTALSTANTASSNASAAVTTANTASSNASAAVSTANTANSNATNAVNTANAATVTANSAAADAATAISTANGAVSTANGAVSTANSASTAATNAVNTANAASSAASSAVSTANTASTNASNAVTTANTASTNATTAVNTANAATVTANAAAAAVANAVLYTTVANVAAIPATPANNTAVEVTNSTGIESFTPLSGKPVGFVGSSGLSVRIIYQTAGTTWTWIQYFPNDPENRYLKEAGDTMTGALGVTAGTAAAPSIFVSGDINTGLFSPGADEFGIATGGVGRFFIDAAGNVVVPTALSVNGEDVVVDNDARLTDTRTPTDGTVTDTKVSATAAIAGTKISPNFGSQTITTTGVVSAAAGAAATPSLTFTGDLNTGIYSPGADQVAISTGGSGCLFIDASGRVGVGVSSPGYALDVLSVTSGTVAARFRGNASATNNTQIRFYGANAATDQWAIGNAIDSNDASRNFDIYDIVAVANRLRIDSSGRVGIGTSSPGSLLTLGTNTPRLEFNDGDSATDNKRWQFVTGATSFTIRGLTDAGAAGGNAFSFNRSNENINSFQASAGGTAWFHIDNSTQRVGIGTTSASQKLHIADTSAAFTRYESGSFDAYVGQRSSGILEIAQAQAGNITLLTNGSERCRVDSSGRFLVGTSTARSNFFNGSNAALFQVEGTTLTTAATSLVRSSADAFGPVGVFGKSRNASVGGNTIVNSGDECGILDFQGNDGTEFVSLASIAGVVDGTPGANDMPGRLVFATTADGASSPTERMRISSLGDVTFSTTAASITPGNHTGGLGNASARVLGVARNTGTNRSINASGTINASGADYAEYMTKAGDFTIAKGDICGITADGLLTLDYSSAISFVVKSTNPSYVGGDTWGEGYDDDPKGLEVARQTVDRIAFAGQAPVNVPGATPGQYIVPVEAADGGIAGIAKNEAELTMTEYMRAIGKVIAIEDDGRPRIIVKVA